MDYESIIKETDSLLKEINSLRPLEKVELAQLREYYRIGLTYSSNAIEGNSLTETETKVVIEDGLTVNGKPLRDHLEAVGHAEAFSLLYASTSSTKISEDIIKKLHRVFYHGIDEKNAGVYRNVRVVITGTDYLPPSPEKVPDLMKKLVSRIPEIEKKNHPVVAAADLHTEFVNIHPFVDGNGRVSRLLMNMVLIKYGYPVVIIPPTRRREYISAVMSSNFGNFNEIRTLVAEMSRESCRDYLRMFSEKQTRGVINPGSKGMKITPY
ncbi:MAG TPA: cell filamentation protein Fic [Lentisphaeria bacterium]|nr:MAG: cell filamentation protein Fic [Lentisphaerae bacterium GWF2_49_21]HBC87174.1 cell filamentation protein Fic [Lentisphaeria bacterium]